MQPLSIQEAVGGDRTFMQEVYQQLFGLYQGFHRVTAEEPVETCMPNRS
jgi:hypothetical protein